MIPKYVISGLTFLVLIFTSAFAQDWRNSPLNSKNSDAWRNKPYTGQTSDSWRKSPLNSNDSQLRWNKNQWQKSKLNWRNSNTRWNKKNWQDRPTNWRNSPNKWNKEKWRDNPLNWRNSDLEWKNSRRRLEPESAKQEIKEWGSPKIQELPSDTEETKAEPSAKEDFKPQMEIVVSDDNISKGSITEATKHFSAKDNSIVVYSSEGVKLIQPDQSNIKQFDDGTVVIYGTNSDN
jgi:hypothetical protein